MRHRVTWICDKYCEERHIKDCNFLLVCSTFRVGCPLGNSCECDNRLETNESGAQDQFNTILTTMYMYCTWSLTFRLSLQKLVWFPLQCVLHHHLWFYLCSNTPLPMARQPPVGQGLLIVEASRPHSDTQQSVELPWMGDQLDRDLYLTTHNTVKRKTPLSSTGFEPAIPAN